MGEQTTLTWPENTRLYETIRRIKAAMPKPGPTKYCPRKPLPPNGNNHHKKA